MKEGLKHEVASAPTCADSRGDSSHWRVATVSEGTYAILFSLPGDKERGRTGTLQVHK